MSKHMSTPKMLDIFNLKSQDTPQPQPVKRISSMPSPTEAENTTKKKYVTEKTTTNAANQNQDGRTDLQLILHEFKSLKDTVDDRVTRLEAAITKHEEKFTEELHKLENTISKNRSEVAAEIKSSIAKNSLDIQDVLEENKILRKENSNLKERMSRLESAQLCNNVIITRIQEQQWEPYETTKQRVKDTIATAFKSNNDTEREDNKKEQKTLTSCIAIR